MWSNAPTIAAGDTVIVWQTRENLIPLVIEPGNELNGRFGVYSHSDLVGVPFGSKVASRNGRGFIHVLRPTPELWTLALPHRTQILYLADIAFITARLNVRPGSVVVEAGTGSGSFSHALARTVGPKGKLHTFEYHALRAEKAREEFERHGMLNAVVPSHRNVCKDGFGDLVDIADAIFLDLPAPWEAASYAFSTMRKDRMSRICCFSPCIEQVLRTVTALNDAGFSDIDLYEVLLTPQEVIVENQPLDIKHAVSRLKLAEVKKEARRQNQIAISAAKQAAKDLARAEETAAASLGHGATVTKRHREDSPAQTAADTKRLRITENDGIALIVGEEVPAATDHPYMRPAYDVRGHTSYLTFACIRPRFPVSLAHAVPASVLTLSTTSAEGTSTSTDE